jgi:hypothetical protein
MNALLVRPRLIRSLVVEMETEVNKLTDDSADSVGNGFDHFAVPPSRTSVRRGKYEEILPQAGGSKTGMIEFLMRRGDGVYTDLANSYLKLTVSVRKSNGAVLTNADAVPVWPVENFAHSLFQKVQVFVNDQEIEFHKDYPQVAHLWNLLNYDKATRESSMYVSSGWLEDASRATDGGDVEDDEKAARRGEVRESKKMSFFLRLRSGFLSNDRLLFPGFSLGVKLTRTTPQLALMAEDNTPADGARIDIEDASLYVYRLQANSSLFDAQMQELLSGARLLHPMRRIKSQTRLMTQGTSFVSIEVVNQTQRPSYLVVGLMKSTAYSGAYADSPFKYSNYDASRVELNVEGMGESVSYTPNFRTGVDLARPYAALASLVDRYDTGRAFGVSFDEWRTKSTLWAFDLTDDKSRADGFQLMKSGRLDLRFHFNTALPHNVTAFMMMEYDDMVEMGLDNNVTTKVPLL